MARDACRRAAGDTARPTCATAGGAVEPGGQFRVRGERGGRLLLASQHDD